MGQLWGEDLGEEEPEIGEKEAEELVEERGTTEQRGVNEKATGGLRVGDSVLENLGSVEAGDLESGTTRIGKTESEKSEEKELRLADLE